jgi:hypothetical protein
VRVLIVDGNLELSLFTGQLLLGVYQPAPRVEMISLAGNLETAIRLLPEHDAVLYEGQFPISRNSISLEEEWDSVYRAAVSRGIRSVLYSGSTRSLDEARNNGIAAISKPAAIEEVHALLAGQNRKSPRRKTVSSSAVA